VENFPLEDYLYHADYDVGYQDIGALDLTGYSVSHKTWQNIRKLIDWQGKSVIDLGCFHGYFCFKVEDAGGNALGLDKSNEALIAAEMINHLRGGHVGFRQWTGGDPVPRCDVILCLNVMHHFGDRSVQEMALSRMDCDYAIFEIDSSQAPLVQKYFKVVKHVRSHRKNRIILKCKRIRQEFDH